MHGWRLPPGKIYLPFKTMKNTKIADLFLSMNSSYDLDDLSPKKIKILQRKEDLEAFLSSLHGWLPETKWFLFCLPLFFYNMLFRQTSNYD